MDGRDLEPSRSSDSRYRVNPVEPPMTRSTSILGLIQTQASSHSDSPQTSPATATAVRVTVLVQRRRRTPGVNHHDVGSEAGDHWHGPGATPAAAAAARDRQPVTVTPGQ